VAKGLSQYDFHPTPRLLEFPREAGKIISVHAHGFASYAISETGELWVWGTNQESQLGLGEGAPKVIETPRRGPSFPSPRVDLAPGVCHVIALTRDGSLWTWRSKEAGRLGIPHEDHSFIKIPHKIPVPDVVRVFAGSGTSLVLTKNGALYIWGWGGFGQLGQSSGFDYYNHEPQMIFPSGVLDVACGWTHYLALLEDRTVWGWDHNDCKKITSQDVPEVSNPVPIEIPGEAGKIRGVIAGNSYSAFILEQCKRAPSLFALGRGGTRY
jgi:alpha-tubulin suppressor-like RCC1 family protein